MRLSCPSCQTEYDVPDTALTGRARKLRCAQCGHQWQTAPPVVAIPDLPPAAAEPERMPQQQPVFGVAVDAAAEREVLEAAAHEGPVAEDTAYSDEPMALPDVPEDPRDREHRDVLNMLVNASRSNALEENTATEPKKLNKAWLFSILVLFLFIAYVFLGREHIMHVWPPSIRFYHVLGLG